MYFQRIWISYSVCSNFLSCGTVKKQSNYVCKQHFYIKPELFFFHSLFAPLIWNSDMTLLVNILDGQVELLLLAIFLEDREYILFFQFYIQQRV